MSDSVKIVTFNVRCTWDWLDGFVSRMGLIYEKIRKEKPDVVAFQEVTAPILDGLKHIMPNYLFVGHGRDEHYDGEGLYTAINLDTLQLIGTETFWIAPNPYDKKSKFSDQSPFPRICVSATVYHPRTCRELRLYNVHLDHEGTIAQTDGMKCVLQHVYERNRQYYTPTVILGDLNVEPDSPAIEVCKKWKEPELFDITEGLPGTFHDYGKWVESGISDMKIDYILVTEDLKDSIQEAILWQDKLNGHFLSDHYPICATFR